MVWRGSHSAKTASFIMDRQNDARFNPNPRLVRLLHLANSLSTARRSFMISRASFNERFLRAFIQIIRQVALGNLTYGFISVGQGAR
jgi:hypothetical protein